MTTVRRLTYNESVTLDGSGNGTIRLAPSNVEWKIETLTVKTSTRTLEPQATIYLNILSDGGYIEGTDSGGRDTSDTVHYLNRGDCLFVYWSGGDPGAIATVAIKGWETIIGNTGGIDALR